MKTAGIARARVLATVLPNDAANVFITLSARNMNPRIQIIARGEVPSTERKLLQAGANRVVLPAEVKGAFCVSVTTPIVPLCKRSCAMSTSRLVVDEGKTVAEHDLTLRPTQGDVIRACHAKSPHSPKPNALSVPWIIHICGIVSDQDGTT